MAIREIMRRLRWRTSPQRVRQQAGRMILAHGDAALFRVYDAAWRARGDGDLMQARYWETIARETAHQLRREAILADILQPLPSPPPTLPPVDHTPLPVAAQRGVPLPHAPHLRLVHPQPPSGPFGRRGSIAPPLQDG